MAMVGNKDPKSSTVADLKAQEKSYKKAHSDFLKGRSIKKAEDDAKKLVAKAEEDAQHILDNAETIQAQANSILVEAKQIKKSAEIITAEAVAKMAEAKRLFDVNKLTEEELSKLCDTNKNNSDIANRIQNQYKEKLNKVNKALTELLND